MADIIINAKHQQRHDTEANWTSKNPVLLDGEMGFVTGTQKYKIGDGTSKWSTLAYHTSLTDTEKSKLDGIATGANKTTVDSALSSTSTNPVQNKVINTALSGKANTNHSHDLSAMINGLSGGTDTPSDADYYVSQYAGGGTTSTTYHRRPMKALFEYIKGKLSKVAVSGSYNDLSNKPTIPSVGNGTVTIKQGGTSKGTFTMNQSGNTTIELTDTKYTHPSYTSKSNGLYKVTVDATGHVSGTTAVSKADITALGIPSTNTTYSTGTTSALGLTKLYAGTGTATDGTMTQAAIKSALDGKSSSGHTHTSVNDSNNSNAITFSYSKSDMTYENFTYFAVWNGYELRTIPKTHFAASGHTHDDRYYTKPEINTKLNNKVLAQSSEPSSQATGDIWLKTTAL